MDTVLAITKACDGFIIMCAIIHLNAMTPQSSKCEMLTWWLVAMAAFADMLFGYRTSWDEGMMNIAFVLLTFECTRYHFQIPHFCKFRDRRRKQGVVC